MINEEDKQEGVIDVRIDGKDYWIPEYIINEIE